MTPSSNRPGGNITGVVAALRSEASCLTRRRGRSGAEPIPSGGLMVEASGMGCQRAACAAQRLVRAGARSLLCWGVAGALDPSLRCGDVVLATEVICEGPLALHLPATRPIALPAHARLRTSDSWRSQMATTLQRQGPVVEGTVLTSAELVCGASDKSRLFRQTGAMAVDMESAAVGVVARLHQVPFMVLRVIADTAVDEMPPVLRLLAGSQSLGRLAWITWLPLVCSPAAWPGLARLGQRYRVARRVLQECARHGRPRPPQGLQRP